MSDEGFHEIQLNGKQLVFLFMAATVVAVVIFLCGVMVGRGVPTRAASAGDVPGLANLDPTAAAQEPPSVQAAAGTGNAPVTTQEDLTYPVLLRDPDPPAETLRPPVERTADVLPPAAPRLASVAPPLAPPIAAAPRPDVGGGGQASGQIRASVPAAPVSAAAVGSLAEPPGAGFVVQVAAVRQLAEANTIARRLSTKGYPAFVTTAGANFRVRVGKYDDRREAESVAGRLEKEERFNPWITR